ncbi:MAG: hypothetical protein OEV85_03575 [Candidatus Thorarchaeota archaeon]|nr:hypothetical protein [Candidatus Thorarchaeota archaeon]
MITSTELLQRYRRIVSEPIKGDLDESIALLYKTDWVKIMIVRDAQSSEPCSIEIEITLPPCIIEPSTDDADSQKEIARKFIEDTISHLEYLLRLEEAGLILGIISTEGIWCASLFVCNSPDETFFEVLIPPC